MLEALPLVFVLAGLALYTVLGGADLGAGFWQLPSEPSVVRDLAHRSMAPVWEANHVWLIFVLTISWTAYPKAFASAASTLAVPLLIALIGLMLRGLAYALRSGAATAREAGRLDTLFALSSILVPFALGAAVGGIATDRVPVGNASGDLWSSWLNATSILVGILAIATSAYLAAVFLAADAAHDGERELERMFRLRALVAGAAAGALALAGIFIVDADNDRLFHSLLGGRAVVAVIASGLAGLATLALVYRRRYEPARYSAAVAVAAVIAGWALSRWPTILPNLTVHQAAAQHDVLVCVVVAVLAGGIILFPALALLFRLTTTGRFRGAPSAASLREEAAPTTASPGALLRLAAGCLIAGVGLLNVAGAGWAHAAGVAALIGFVVLAFVAIALPGFDEQATTL